MRIGIVGLPNAGKSSLFNLLTSGSVPVETYPFTTIDANHGMAALPDPSLASLGNLLSPEKLTPAMIEIIDIAGLIKDAHKGEGLGNKFLGHIRDVDLIFHVIRGFENSDVAHVSIAIDPAKDREVVLAELALADLEIVERKFDYDRKRADAKDELTLLERFRTFISQGSFSLNGSYSVEERLRLKSLGLLIPRPRVDVLNLSDKKREILLDKAYRLSVRLEEELADFPEQEKEELRREAMLDPSGSRGLLERGLEELGLIRFYTIKGSEVRSWILPDGLNALNAAEKIHSDIADGFIKTEVLNVNELLEIGSWHEASAAGRLKVKGKDYIVQNGDVLLIKFR